MEKESLNNQDILKVCVDDRFRFSIENHLDIPIPKKLNVDLLIKFIWMMWQSFGKNEQVGVLFVDEVRNKSMFENLYATIDHCPVKYRVINLGSAKSKYPHTKIGYFMPVVYMIGILLAHVGVYACIPFAGWKWVNEKSSEVLMFFFQKYLRHFHGERCSIYCMSDHHFYSTIACCDKNLESHVIQHGLVLDKSYYYPIHADHFLSWGERSREELECHPKVQVTGTYKFSRIKPAGPNTGERCLLYCVSIVDTQLVTEKIVAMMPVAKELGYRLKVKMHPGSFFSTEELEKRFRADGLEFYKECALADIEFDIAVIENSTILVDLLFLNKPFVIFDDKNGYFSLYGEDVPWCEKKDGFKAAVQKAQNAENGAVYQGIMQNELNSGECTIWKTMVKETD